MSDENAKAAWEEIKQKLDPATIKSIEISRDTVEVYDVASNNFKLKPGDGTIIIHLKRPNGVTA